MAEESNVHIKVAGAEVLGLFLVGGIAILVGLYGLEVFDDLLVIAGVAGLVGLGLFLTTIIAYLNENILVSAAFGMFSVFLLGFAAMAGPVLGGAPEANIAAMYCTIFVGVGLLLVGLVSFAQPVKILPIFLIIAALAFVCLGLWFDADLAEDMRMVVGILWTIAALMAMYMATAIAFLVVKGKQVLPLLVKA